MARKDMGYPAGYPIRDGMGLRYSMGKKIPYPISFRRYGIGI